MLEKFFGHVDLLRAKPHHVRERVTLGAAVVVTLALFLVWGAREKEKLSLNQNDQKVATDGVAVSRDATQAASPFDALVQVWRGIVGSGPSQAQ